MAEKRTEIRELGEFGLIEKIKSRVKLHHPRSIYGIGDDAAVIDDGEEVILLTSDMLNESVHFDLSYTPLIHLGYKAVAVNVSDIVAMNGIPGQITVSLGLSNRFSVEAIEELYQGIQLACANYKIDLIGGDTTSSRAGLIISISALGFAKKTEVCYRHTAKVNDLLCVTGDLGGAYLGLQLLEREKQVYLSNPAMQPELEGKDYVVQRQLKPEARMDVIYELRELGIVPTAMIDISDGLASEVLHLCKSSGLGAVIMEDKLPIDEQTYATALEFNLEPLTCILNGGEDYELLFTIKQEDLNKLKNHPDITVIGLMKEASAGVNVVTKAGNSFPLKAQGWVHF